MLSNKHRQQSFCLKDVKKNGKLIVDANDDSEDRKKTGQLIKPKDQLDLTETELKETIDRHLSTVNPHLQNNLVQYNYAQGAFTPLTNQTNVVVVYESIGSLIHKDSKEAQLQLVDQAASLGTSLEESESDFGLQNVTDEVAVDQDDERSRTEKAAGEEEGDGEDESEAKSEVKIENTKKKVSIGGSKGRKVTNQFNFCDRAVLTCNGLVRSQDTQTSPPAKATFSANVLQWIIYDAYLMDYENQQLEKDLEKEKKEKEKAPVSKNQPVKKMPSRTQLNEAKNARIFECWKVLERMVNQNTFDDIAKDYRYWDDPSDEFRDEEGTLLPLWKFNYEKTKYFTITDIEWNPYYHDLFAVCFGSLDFVKPTAEGAICLFTVKNPSFPDYICLTDSGVMCVDIHPRYPYMVVVGLNDGSVEVFNVQTDCRPIYSSTNVANKHKAVVWEVKWGPDLADGELNFFSVAADGYVNNWVLMQNELSLTTIITLHFDMDCVTGPDGQTLKVKCCASCIKMHPTDPLIYLVGTEEGDIFKCSTAYNSMSLMTYHAHQMPVYRIDFNKFNSSIFISCSSDWRIKIWEDNRPDPLFGFDLGDRIGDVKWAPYSSSVFAAVTTEGKVYVFDLNVNKYQAICIQAIVSKRKNKLTRLSFNPKLPIIIVGDDKGCTTTLKLSPNLRQPCKPPKKQQHLDQWTLQCMKLGKLLSLVREPVISNIIEEKTESEDM